MRKMSTLVLMHLYNDLAAYGVNTMVNCVMSLWVVVMGGEEEGSKYVIEPVTSIAKVHRAYEIVK
jgi:hypothetical protein